MHISKRLAALSGSSEVSFSYEFFCPDSDDGFEALRARIDRLSATEPTFVDIVSFGESEDIRRGLRLCRYAKKVDGLSSMLHISCADFTKDEFISLLNEAKGMGIDNLLLERGSKVAVNTAVRPSFVGIDVFNHVHDLVSFIQSHFGNYFCVGVMGYPSGRGAYDTLEEDMEALKKAVEAGADFVLAQHVNEAKVFLDFHDAVVRCGIRVPVIPSIMPVLSYESFLQVNTYCGVNIPPGFLAGLQSLQDDDKAVREYGNRFVVQLAKDLINAGVNMLHFHTMNLEVVIRNVLQDIGLCGPGAGTRRKLPWRPSGEENRATEDVRPIFWANRPASYVERTAGWASFPSGRWGAVASTLSFNDVTEAVATKPSDAADIEERRVMWGEALTSHQDVWEVFARYVQGRVPRLPWCDVALHLETFTIANSLTRINRSGFLTINSQPRVNAAKSDDPTFGWGGTGGYIYQKAYIECFTPPSHLSALMEACSRHPSITFQAVDASGNTYSNYKTKSAQAVTWGVFPGKEILQPTVVDPGAFLEWKKEAFSLWLSEWACIYDEDATAADVVHEIHSTYFLVNLVDNDYIRGDIFAVFEDAIGVLRASADVGVGHSAPGHNVGYLYPTSPKSKPMGGLLSSSPGLFDLGPAFYRTQSEKSPYHSQKKVGPTVTSRI